ncbi:MAG: HipA N-terminal domain-containing protein [Kiritimatiellae bacterium]|nr:HipA N-terminal domain-containing protein [Kiritimatiellia bacterium]
MNRKGRVLNRGVFAGVLQETDTGFRFVYDATYLRDSQTRPISRTMPKREEPYESEHLFPFFHGLLAEGVAKEIQCRSLKIDERDHFGRLLKTAGHDPIGSVTVEEVHE